MRLILCSLSILFLAACGGNSGSSKESDQSQTTSGNGQIPKRQALKLLTHQVDGLNNIKFKTIDSSAISPVKNFE